MKKVIIAAMACALCFVLGGCAGQSGAPESSSSDPMAAWVGTWDLTEMQSAGKTTGADDIEELKKMGLDVYLELNEDGTGSLVLFGEAIKSSWAVQSATEAVFNLDDQVADMTLSDGKINMEQNGSKLVFSKGEPREASSSSASSSSSSAVSDSAGSSASS